MCNFLVNKSLHIWNILNTDKEGTCRGGMNIFKLRLNYIYISLNSQGLYMYVSLCCSQSFSHAFGDVPDFER